MSVTETHEEKETLSVDVNIPGHDPRVTTALFRRTREELISTEGGRCFVCGRTKDEVGPLEAHHHPIERSFAEMIDWHRVATDCKAGLWGAKAQAFPWESFLAAQPFDPYAFVDDMTVNGLLVCKAHHIGKDEGIHSLPYPIWLAQRYGKEGYQFSAIEIIHHEG